MSGNGSARSVVYYFHPVCEVREAGGVSLAEVWRSEVHSWFVGVVICACERWRRMGAILEVW